MADFCHVTQFKTCKFPRTLHRKGHTIRMGLNRQNYIFKYTVKPQNILRVGIAVVKSVYDLTEISVGDSGIRIPHHPSQTTT